MQHPRTEAAHTNLQRSCIMCPHAEYLLSMFDQICCLLHLGGDGSVNLNVSLLLFDLSFLLCFVLIWSRLNTLNRICTKCHCFMSYIIQSRYEKTVLWDWSSISRSCNSHKPDTLVLSYDLVVDCCPHFCVLHNLKIRFQACKLGGEVVL